MLAFSAAAFLNDGRRFVNFVQRKARAAANVDENSLRALNRIVFEQRAGDGAIRGVHRAIRSGRNGGAHHGITLAAHDRFHVCKVAIDDAGHGNDVRNVPARPGAKCRPRCETRRRSWYPRSDRFHHRSLGITMTVSTAPIKSCSACSACIMRRLPSNANGLCHDRNSERAEFARGESHHGAAPEPYATEAGRDENHVRAFKRFNNLSVSSSAAFAAAFYWRPRPGVG